MQGNQGEISNGDPKARQFLESLVVAGYVANAAYNLFGCLDESQVKTCAQVIAETMRVFALTARHVFELNRALLIFVIALVVAAISNTFLSVVAYDIV